MEIEKNKKKIWFPDYKRPAFANKLIDSAKEINKYDYFWEGQAYTIRSPSQKKDAKELYTSKQHKQADGFNSQNSSFVNTRPKTANIQKFSTKQSGFTL